MRMSRTRKGQFTPVVLVFFAISLLYFIFLYPVIDSVIQDNVGSMDAGTAAIVKLFPFGLILAIFGSMWFWVVPQRREFN